MIKVGHKMIKRTTYEMTKGGKYEMIKGVISKTVLNTLTQFT